MRFTCNHLSSSLFACIIGASASADIVHVTFPPTTWEGDFTLDVDSNSVADFALHFLTFDGDVTSLGSNGLLVDLGNGINLPAGYVVGPVLPTEAYYNQAAELWTLLCKFEHCDWYCIACGDVYLGLRFEAGANTHYGWLHLAITPLPEQGIASVQPIDMAYDTTPNTPVITGYADCDGNGANDYLQITGNPALDCNSDWILDACQPQDDCNDNRVLDLCEIAAGTLTDCNANLHADACEIAANPALDCDGNGVIDACEVSSHDCNGNGVIDACELASNPDLDCNENGELDSCELGLPFANDAHALSFDGIDDFGSAPGLGLSLPTSEITIELWIRPTAVANSVAFGALEPETNRCSAHIPWGDNVVYFDFGDWAKNGRIGYTPPDSIIGSWQHFAFVASASQNAMRIYRNGVLEAEKRGMEPRDPVDADFALGAVESFPVASAIDEFRIWDHVRTGDEIARDLNATVDPSSRGLIGYWRFDEGTGRVAHDIAAGHDGVLFNGPVWVDALCASVVGDLDGDGAVSATDLGILLGSWGQCGGCAADLNGDGAVSAADLGILLGAWTG